MRLLTINRGVAQLVAHSLLERGVVGSSLATPTIFELRLTAKGIESMKISLFLPIFLVISLYSHKLPDIFYYQFASAEQFSPAAQQWSKTITSVASPADIQDVLKLLLASFDRSLSTLKTQRAYIELLETAATGWDHIVATRRNPSVVTNIDAYSLAHCSSKDFYALLSDLQTVQREYVSVTERMVTDKEHRYLHLKPAIATLRDRSRAAVHQSLVNSLDSIRTELGTAQQQLLDAAQQFADNTELASSKVVTKGILDTVWDYVPALLVRSFVAFDRSFTASTKASAHAYFTSQEVGNFIWHIIECPRAAFYASYYQALYESVDRELTYDLPTPSSIIDRLNAPYACH